MPSPEAEQYDEFHFEKKDEIHYWKYYPLNQNPWLIDGSGWCFNQLLYVSLIK